MRADICTREETDTQAALLDALAAAGAAPEDDATLEVPLAVGLHRFRVGTATLTVYADAWGVDLEGPDELVGRVLSLLTGSE